MINTSTYIPSPEAIDAARELIRALNDAGVELTPEEKLAPLDAELTQLLSEEDEPTPIYDALLVQFERNLLIRDNQDAIRGLRDNITDSAFVIDDEELPKALNNIGKALLDTLMRIQPSVFSTRTEEQANQFNWGFYLAIQTLLGLNPEKVPDETL